MPVLKLEDLMKKNLLVCLAVVSLMVTNCFVFAEGQPPVPTFEVPKLETINPPILCVDCEEPFDTVTHSRILRELVTNPYLKQLRRALYKQDILHQFESKAHFDNCDFESSAKYILELLDGVGQHVQRALAATENNNTKVATSAIEDAFFSLGQALHGVQDFYAHSNYIEMMVPTAKKVTDIPLVLPWRNKGFKKLQSLQKEGLVSGVVWWGFPKHCAAGTADHADLAKDSSKTTSGKIRISHLQNTNQYKIAEFLARESSLALLSDAYQKWPILRKASGDYIAFETMIDRRNMSN
jgi:heterokaryon incompatibility protein Het-C